MAIKKNGEVTTPAELANEAASAAVDTAPAVVESAVRTTETAASAAVHAGEQAKAVATQGYERTVASLKDGMAGAVAGFDKSQSEVKANMEKIMKTAEEMMSFSQGNVEAFLKASQIWVAGVQEMGKQVAAPTQAQIDQSVTTFKALTSVKSLKEAIDLQSTHARSSMEKAVAESSKFTDASMKLAEQAIAPLTARMSLAVEKFGRTV